MEERCTLRKFVSDIIEKERFSVSHNYLDKEQYENDIKKFNEIVNSIDTKMVDIIWRKSSAFA